MRTAAAKSSNTAETVKAEMHAGLTSFSPKRLILLSPCSTASRITALMDSFSPLPPTENTAKRVSSSNAAQTMMNRVRLRFVMIHSSLFYGSVLATVSVFSGTNIMTKLTDSRIQQSQIAL